MPGVTFPPGAARVKLRVVDATQLGGVIAAAALAIVDGRAQQRANMRRVLSLAANLGPRVEQLQREMAYVKGHLGMSIGAGADEAAVVTPK